MKDFKIVFVVGAGRSGTTWLHMMLGASPSIATGQESQLFDRYLRRLYDQWQRELRYPENDKLRKHGISSYIKEQHFIRLLREFAVSVFSSVLEAKEGATVFLEKSPNNSWNVELILKCFPEAKFIHMLRDGRDVTASMLAAKSGWGHQWAPSTASAAAREWRDAVTECQKLKDLTDEYYELRYETLQSNEAEELKRVFDFLDVPVSTEETAAIFDRFRFDKLKKGDYKKDVFLNPGESRASGTQGRPEPEGFFRKGVAGDWVNSLSRAEQAEIHWEAGQALVSLGYADLKDLPVAKPWSMRMRDTKVALKRAVRRVGAKLLG